MFEIYVDDALFRLSFVERIEEPEDRRLDLITCWLEAKRGGINLQCECEFSLHDLESLRTQLSEFYKAISEHRAPTQITYSPRYPTFKLNIFGAKDSNTIGFNFRVTPDVVESWALEGGMIIDQSYLTTLIAGIDSILTN